MFARFSFIAVIALLASGCANTSPTLGSKNISYGDTKAVETVTNEFGSTDLQMIAESMTRSWPSPASCKAVRWFRSTT